MKYESLPRLTKEQAQAALRDSDIDVVRRAVPVLPDVDDWDWAEACLRELTSHEDEWVAGSAVIGLSELVRIGRQTDLGELRAFLVAIAATRKELAGRVQSALGDIEEVARTRRDGGAS